MTTTNANRTLPRIERAARRPDWPRKLNIAGVMVSPTHYAEAQNVVLDAAECREGGVVSCQAVHAVVTSSCDEELRTKVNRFDMITPDGQPVRWALNLLYRANLTDRVYGPELMLRLCETAASRGVSIYLYGGSPEVACALERNLISRFPDLQVTGCESPPFRDLSAEEEQAVADRVNASGAGLMFIGLGCPKQDHFAAAFRDRILAVQICIGAAFDFHAGDKKMAPAWMQRNGLEWLYRLCQEPRRLWRRYLVTNTIFVVKLSKQWLKQRVWSREAPTVSLKDT